MLELGVGVDGVVDVDEHISTAYIDLIGGITKVKRLQHTTDCTLPVTLDLLIQTRQKVGDSVQTSTLLHATIITTNIDSVFRKMQ